MHVCEMKPQAEAVTPAMDVAVGDDYRHPCVQTTVHCTVYTSRCKTIATLTILVCRPMYTSRCKTGQTVQLQMQEYGHTLKRETCVHLKMQTWLQTIAFFVYTYFTVHSVVVHWAFTSTSVMGNTIGTLISHCAKFFRWHILLVAHIVAHIACSSEAAEGGYELADGFPARGRRLSFWQRTDLWIHNAYVNPQMVPLDTSPDSLMFRYFQRLYILPHLCVSEGSHKLSSMCLIKLADKTLPRKCGEKWLTARIGHLLAPLYPSKPQSFQFMASLGISWFSNQWCTRYTHCTCRPCRPIEAQNNFQICFGELLQGR